MKEPRIYVGIMSEAQISFELSGHYRMKGSYCQGVVSVCRFVKGVHTVRYREKGMEFDGQVYENLRFDPAEEDGSFLLKDVTIGINFHWERKEEQRFLGALKFIVEGEKLTAVNIIPVEEYLASVISSEMSATASLELLKAHAVISRSWLLANISGRLQYQSDMPSLFWQTACEKEQSKKTDAPAGDDGLKWYDNESHAHFDVCADDHCQRYQGVTRASTELVKQAVADTCGQVLTWEGKICDARFSKCCGGMLEEFQYCWENIRHPYLSKRRDWKGGTGTGAEHTLAAPDLTQESEARRWILTSPEAFCHTTDKSILAQVLNNYDRETANFYRWRIEYTQEELSALIRERSGTDYGEVIDLIPVARGTSGRIWKLKIVGSKQTRVIGKELEIRRTLSHSHLYSSAFVIDKEEGTPTRFILTGAGWGHGVGLCQIGAAVMGERGYRYDEILLHYYTNARITTLYNHEQETRDKHE